MLSTIPNVKRAEISSPSPKSSSQNRSQHSPMTVVGETHKTDSNTKKDNLSLSISEDDRDKSTSGERASLQEEQTSALDKSEKRIEHTSKLENCSNKEVLNHIENNVHNSSINVMSNASSNLSDMSRRKQRNPKPSFFSSLEDKSYNKKAEDMQIVKEQYQEHPTRDSERSINNASEGEDTPGEENHPKSGFTDASSRSRDIADNGNSIYSSSRSSSSPTPPPHDLSSMVKVEVHEGNSVLNAPNTTSNLEHNFNQSGSSRLATNCLPTLTPMPSQQRPILMPNPPLMIPTPGLATEAEMMARNGAPSGLPVHLSKLMMSQFTSDAGRHMGISKEDMTAKQNNMFHFGDVSVAHHPDTAPVPMIIPMVYLYPLPTSIDDAEKREVKYRMLVPLGGGGTPVVNPLMPSMTGENTSTMPQKLRTENIRVSSEVSQEQEKREKCSPNISGNRKRDTTTPLDLTKSQIIEDHELLKRNSISLTVESTDKDIRNKQRHESGGSDIDRNNFSATSISPSISQRKNKEEASPVTDVEQRASIGSLVPPLIPGGISEAMLSASGGALLPQQEAILKMQQKEFEAQLNFLKNKHLEFMKNQQHIQQQRQPNALPSHPQSSISRCEECNINFSKHQNYIAHKKYYCSANANKANPPTNTMQIVSDNDDEDLSLPSQHNMSQIQPQISPRVSPPKKEISPAIIGPNHRSVAKPLGQRTPSVSPSASIGSNQSVSQGMSSMAMQAAAQAAINNFLAMSNSVQGKDTSLINGPITKELLLLKQQQELLSKDSILSKEAAFHALKTATLASSNVVGQDKITLNSNHPDSSTPSPQEKLPLSSSKTPPSSSLTAGPSEASIASGLQLTHFCCEGCGIKFKSVSNLQAHQARYCAGLRKGGGEEGGMGNPFETMIKRMTTQQQNSAPGHGPSLPPNQIMNGIQADMMSFLNARSLEQQLQHAEVLKVAAAAHRSESTDKEDVNPPTAGPAAMAAMAAAISAAKGATEQPLNGTSPNKDAQLSVNDDYCCILCGYKESSVERLKDHINMHFIGQVKKPPPRSPRPSSSPNDERDQNRKSKSPHSPPLLAEQLSNHAVNGTERSVMSPPEPKKIKLEESVGTENKTGKLVSVISPPLQRNRLDIQDVAHPKVDMHESGSSLLSAKILGSKKNTPQQELNYPHINDSSNNACGSGEVRNDMRCMSCDIGFSQMSNYLAHKKYYCRGLLSASPTQMDIKLPLSGEPLKLQNVILSPDREVDENPSGKK